MVAMYDRIWIPPTRKEIEQKLKKWGVTKINGIPLRDLSKRILKRAYRQKARQLLEEQKQLALGTPC
jgi:hypothetical protein